LFSTTQFSQDDLVSAGYLSLNENPYKMSVTNRTKKTT